MYRFRKQVFTCMKNLYANDVVKLQKVIGKQLLDLIMYVHGRSSLHFENDSNKTIKKKNHTY